MKSCLANRILFLGALGLMLNSCHKNGSEPSPGSPNSGGSAERLDSSYHVTISGPDESPTFDTAKTYYTYGGNRLMAATRSILRGQVTDETYSYDGQNRLAKYLITAQFGSSRYTSTILYTYRFDGLVSKAEVSSIIPNCVQCGGEAVTEIHYDNANRPKFQTYHVTSEGNVNGGSGSYRDSITYEYALGNLLTKVNTFTLTSGTGVPGLNTKSLTYTPDNKHVKFITGQLRNSMASGSNLGPFYYDDGISARSWFVNSVGLRNRIQMAFDFDARLSLWHNMASNGPCSEVLEFQGPDYSSNLPDYLLYKNHVGNKGLYSLVHNGWDEYVFFTTNPSL